MFDTFPASEKPQETPRKRRLEEEKVGTPKAKRRRGVSTPVRRAVELTHVEGSPAELVRTFVCIYD